MLAHGFRGRGDGRGAKASDGKDGGPATARSCTCAEPAPGSVASYIKPPPLRHQTWPCGETACHHGSRAQVCGVSLLTGPSALGRSGWGRSGSGQGPGGSRPGARPSSPSWEPSGWRGDQDGETPGVAVSTPPGHQAATHRGCTRPLQVEEPCPPVHSQGTGSGHRCMATLIAHCTNPAVNLSRNQGLGRSSETVPAWQASWRTSVA